MEPLAHSARPHLGVPTQSYAKHIDGVMSLVKRHAAAAGKYYTGGGNQLVETLRLAAVYHDLGKLDEANQAVLGGSDWQQPLPLNHVDAGVACLLGSVHRNGPAATLVHSHHKGLPDFPDEQVNAKSFLRDRQSMAGTKPLIQHTDEQLCRYLTLHQKALGQAKLVGLSSGPLGKNALLFRIALSCLVDADHSDTARHCGQELPVDAPPLRPSERLGLLDAYVRQLGQTERGERTGIRRAVYEACRNADVGPVMYACDSPVGTGKTTAVMAHLLQAAIAKGLRRVFVILPFTNIIDQSVDVYRKALVGPGEDGSEIVAAHHHRADFQTVEARQFTFLWRAPIVVTTAVQFFETLASNHPASLRKLHQLPGSAVFIDEAHAALPVHLWPQALLWLQELERSWGCHFVLGSGSLTRFWTLEEFSKPTIELPELVSPTVRETTMKSETRRLHFDIQQNPLGLRELLDWLPSLPGPRLLIFNTVQSAAVVADRLGNMVGRAHIEHLSTALCPSDRKRTLDTVKARLTDLDDSDWSLVATSCVEAGVDLSFRTGLRERCSLNSLLQTAGRVDRHGEYGDSVVWDFQLRHDALLTRHRVFETSARVLGELFTEDRIGPTWTTEAMRREIRQQGMKNLANELMVYERNLQFPQVADGFTVIDSNTLTVVVEQSLKDRLRRREKVSVDDIQKGSVQIWLDREIPYDLQPIDGFPELRFWNLLYDDFLGYMAGVLKLLDLRISGQSVV